MNYAARHEKVASKHRLRVLRALGAGGTLVWEKGSNPLLTLSGESKGLSVQPAAFQTMCEGGLLTCAADDGFGAYTLTGKGTAAVPEVPEPPE